MRSIQSQALPGVAGAKRLDPVGVPGYHLCAISLWRSHLGVLLGLGSNPRLRQRDAAVSEVILLRLWNQIEYCHRLLTARTEPAKADTAHKSPAVLAALHPEAAGIADIPLIDAASTPGYKSRKTTDGTSNCLRWRYRAERHAPRAPGSGGQRERNLSEPHYALQPVELFRRVVHLVVQIRRPRDPATTASPQGGRAAKTRRSTKHLLRSRLKWPTAILTDISAFRPLFSYPPLGRVCDLTCVDTHSKPLRALSTTIYPSAGMSFFILRGHPTF